MKSFDNKVNPVLVELYHGDKVESRHRGCALVMDTDFRVLQSWGDPAQQVCIRSALKPLQALTLVSSGAARRFDVSAAELALACGSHDGEPLHLEAVRNWLRRLGLDESALACGPQLPANREARDQAIRAGEVLSPAYNGCSGKHCGFLTAALHLGLPVAGYSRPDHPLQQRILQSVAERAGVRLQQFSVNQDVCNAPNIFLPLQAAARACATLIDDAQGGAEIIAAMTAFPRMVGGATQYASRCMEQLSGAAALKSGAEGVMLAVLPERKRVVLVKIDDGAARAAEVAATQILRGLGLLQGAPESAAPPMLSSTGDAIGRLIPAAALI